MAAEDYIGDGYPNEQDDDYNVRLRARYAAATTSVKRWQPLDAGSRDPQYRRGAYWEPGELSYMLKCMRVGMSIESIAAYHERSVGAIQAKATEYAKSRPMTAGPTPSWLLPYLTDEDRMYRERARQAALVQSKSKAVTTMSGSDKIKEKYVNMNHLVTLLQKGYTTCEVVFNNPNSARHADQPKYVYKVAESLGVQPGDRVVVEVEGRPNCDEPRISMKVVWAVGVHDEPQIDVSAPYIYKWVVDKVRVDAYNDQLKREVEAVALIKAGERKKAQADAMDALLATVPNRDELLKLLGVQE
jgi:hypothetical protein